MSRPRFAFVIALTSCFLLAHAAYAGINFSPSELTQRLPQPQLHGDG